MQEDVILRFDNVTFEYSENKPVLDEVCFGICSNTKSRHPAFGRM